MLTCVYHPIDDYRVVEDDEAERLKASGIWFDSPLKAKQYRMKVEDEIKNDSKSKGKTNEKK
jgi:hypothetical protein